MATFVAPLVLNYRQKDDEPYPEEAEDAKGKA
jgi:hypothetical protein